MPVYTWKGEELFAGAVISTRERNGYDDSDWFALVWDGNSFTEHMYATTRFAGGGNAMVDATKEVLDAYKMYLDAKAEHEEAVREMEERKNPAIGKRVKALATRGKAKGKRGVVFWRGSNKFRTYYRNGYNRPEDFDNQVIGFEDEEDGQKYFVPATRVTVLEI